MSRTLFFLNPTAGGGRAAAVRERLRSEPWDWIEEENAHAAREALRRRLRQGIVDRVIAVGGDGTAHAVACVLLEEGLGERVALGLVPAGTGSDFARALHLPKRPREALRHALEAEPRPLDAIEVVTDSGIRTYCLNIASAGLSGAVDERVNAAPRRGSYLWTTLRAVLAYRPLPCRVIADGEELTRDPFFVVAMANGRYFGNGMKVAPKALFDDGLLDVVLVPPVPSWQLPVRMPQFLSGRHVDLPEVTVRRAEEVRIEPPAGFFPYDLDGETLEAEPAVFRLLPGALRRIGGR